jgi:dTDP-4-amino-4,6-dideoxygalactose transaminase
MIPFGKQSINEDDIAAVVSALKKDFLTMGPLVESFESKLSEIVGVPCVAVSSGTAALHSAFAALDINPGDEVITPPITFIATQATAAMFGAKIVFADVLLDTGNIDPGAVAAAITSRTRAIVAVDFAGHPADLDELRKLANKHGVFLVEDASHSIGSEYKNIPVGSIADITTFSFFPTKNLTTGEGGAVASSNPELIARARRFSNQGLIRNSKEFRIPNQGSWHQEVHKFGLNYRLPDILCALGLSQLARLQQFKSSRTRIFDMYVEGLKDNPHITLPAKRIFASPMWHLFHIHVAPSIREELFCWLQNSGISPRINYMPAYWHPVFANYGLEIGSFPNSDAFYQTEISIPIYSELVDAQVEYVIDKINEFSF